MASQVSASGATSSRVTALRVTSLHVHPLKGARALSPARLTLDAAGPAHDRRWMLVDDSGRFVSQRELPALATLPVSVRDDGALVLPWATVAPPTADVVVVTVWSSTLPAFCAPHDANMPVSAHFGRSLRLVHVGTPGARTVARTWIDDDVPVAFADGYPVLIAHGASLRALQQSCGVAVPMDRFRPNIVVDGGAAWDEDGWRTLRIGDVRLQLVKPCVRCVVTNTDQATGLVHDEPLRTLARVRRSADARVPGALFAWNAIVLQGGTVQLDDDVVIDERRDPPWPITPA